MKLGIGVENSDKITLYSPIYLDFLGKIELFLGCKLI